MRDGCWGWAPLFFDYDNDGDLDLAMTNGADLRPIASATKTRFRALRPRSARLWRNDGSGRDERESPLLPVSPTSGRARACCSFDYDRDGDLDLFLVIERRGGRSSIATTAATEHDWLRVKVAGVAGFNADAIGAVVTLQADEGGPLQVRQIGASSHFLAKSERIAHFGLGNHPGAIHRLTV